MSTQPLILERALLSGLAGLVPVPWLDDVLAARVRAALLERIADIRGVDLHPGAASTLAHPRPRKLLEAAGAGALRSAPRRTARRLAASLLLARRVDEAIQTWQVATLFDHYCARHHLGLGLDRARAEEVRAAIDAAIRGARVESVRRSFARALAIASGAALAVPRAGRRWWARLRRAPLPAEPAEPAKAGFPVEGGLFRRAATRLGRELASAGLGYLDALEGRFDHAWAAAAGDAA